MSADRAADWLSAGDALRSMSNPASAGDPDHYSKRLYPGTCSPSSTNDNCGVHSNSGIMNFAAYKMMDATKNQVSGEQWARVFYDSLYRLPSTAKFVDARYAIIASARAEGFSAAQIEVIKTAFDSVGIVADKLS